MSKDEDIKVSMRWHRISVSARIMLRDKFGVDLDELGEVSSTKCNTMYGEEIANEIIEQLHKQTNQDVLNEAKKLLSQSKDDSK